MSDIIVKGLSKTYGEKQVLDEFSCCLSDKKVTSIMGTSGCGKTTFLRILMGLCIADSGVITGLEGKRFSVVFQENRLCGRFTVLQNLMMVCKKDRKDEAIKLLNRLGLDDCSEQKVRELSGGMMRRVAIARALLVPYDVLILDEAWKGLDRETKERTIQTVLECSKGKMVISVTHDSRECERMGGNLLEMQILPCKIGDK